MNLQDQVRATDFKAISPCIFAASRGPDYISVVVAHEDFITIQPTKGKVVIDFQMMLTPNNAKLLIDQIQGYLSQMGGVVVDP